MTGERSPLTMGRERAPAVEMMRAPLQPPVRTRDAFGTERTPHTLCAIYRAANLGWGPATQQVRIYAVRGDFVPTIPSAARRYDETGREPRFQPGME